MKEKWEEIWHVIKHIIVLGLLLSPAILLVFLELRK